MTLCDNYLDKHRPKPIMTRRGETSKSPVRAMTISKSP